MVRCMWESGTSPLSQLFIGSRAGNGEWSGEYRTKKWILRTSHARKYRFIDSRAFPLSYSVHLSHFPG